VTDPDHLALELALEQFREKSGRVEEIDQIFAARPWREVAEFAAYYMQMATLNLKPWQIPPCWITDPDNPINCQSPAESEQQYEGRQEAARLLRQMRDAGVSRWHPDPLNAIKGKTRGAA
jgi:hypothetical protein